VKIQAYKKAFSLKWRAYLELVSQRSNIGQWENNREVEDFSVLQEVLNGILRSIVHLSRTK